ncbi:MAG: hypothetical protein QG657_3501 [Acidobacteriota bacterium]|nr:hypothetical protein [Acidobacteriota bacterium]
MRKCKAIAFALMFLSIMFTSAIQAEVKFDDYFVDQTMRIDYYHMADKTTEFITLDKVYQQGTWAGSPNSLGEPFDNGLYYIKIYDDISGTLIYSKGFSSYCSEYMTTNMAAEGIKRTYHETALIPFPKKKIRFTLERRNRQNQLGVIFSQVIDPQSVEINKEALIDGVTVYEILKNGHPHHKVDLAFIAEGYTLKEEVKFKQDVERVVEEFFKQEPYKSRKMDFNIYGLFKASRESGPDEPLEGAFKNTVLGASFNALGLNRYMLTEENRAMRDIAGHVPYDAIVIIVNSQRYGGGGIYNSYCCFTSDNEWTVYLFLHEFGHSFSGLADEYYGSPVSYNEFYPRGIEPIDPNITALLDPTNLKWKHLVIKGTPIPTPWGKEEYEKLTGKDRADFLQSRSKKLKSLVGAFEGAGYTATGLYRPMLNCIMFSKGAIPYCKVCEDTISKVIGYYSL